MENNGNVRTQSIQAGGHTFAQSYNYDALNRLETASETTTVPSGSNWSIGFQYDQYGNMAANGWTISVPAAMATSLAQYDPATNRRSRTAGGAAISPNPYDKGGNLTSDPALGTMQYDQAGRLRQTQVLGKTITYDYDAEGRRVRRDYPGLGTTYYVYDGAGQLAAEYGASEPMSCTRCYLTADTLGSTRLMTDELGGVKQRTDYLPFGDLITASPTQGGGRQVITDGTAQTTFALAGGPTQKFTGKERDAETGLDYFLARYYSGAQGRFTSPDWSERPQPVPYADFEDPQTLNLYAYVRNNPLLMADEDGHCATICTAAIGGAAGFVGSIAIQKWNNPNQAIDWRKVAASTVSGAVAGATLGLGTAPTTIITLKTATTIGAGLAPTLATAAGAGVVGGIAGRVVEGKEPLGENPGDVVTDAVIEMTGEVGSLALKPLLKDVTTAGRALTTIEKQNKPHPTSLNRRTAQHARHVEGAGETVEQGTQGAADANEKKKK